MTNLHKAVLALAILLASASLALAQGTYTQIDVPGSIQTYIYGINNLGQMVGGYGDSSGNGHGFLLSGGIYTTIDLPGALDSFLTGINDAGEMVGTADLGEGLAVGFLYDSSTMRFTSIQYPGASATSCNAINDSGAIIGDFSGPGSDQGFELIGTAYSPVEPPSSEQSFALGISSSGKVVGNSTLTGGINYNFAFLSGQFRERPIRKSSAATLVGINLAGTIFTGYYPNSVGGYNGFLLQNSLLTTLIFPASNLTYGRGVNDSGEVAGGFIDANFKTHGFTWTPPANAERK